MRSPMPPFARSEQILRALAKHGPLSTAGLQALLEPKVQRKAIHATLRRLHRKGLLETRRDGPFKSQYHYINNKPSTQEIVAKWLNLPSPEVRQACFQNAELLHSQACAIWQCRLQKLFPQATVLREHEYPQSTTGADVLVKTTNDSDSRPDLMILCPAENGKGGVAVGVEIERFVKSKKRLLQKLYRYAAQSKLDGVLYVCERDTIEGVLISVWQSDTLAKIPRISHYRQDFLLFSGPWETDVPEPPMYNAALANTSLSAWIHRLGGLKSFSDRKIPS